MNTFTDQLAATRANLERLEKLFAECPDLFEHANLIEVKPDGGSVYIHSSGDEDRDWLALAKKYCQANWKRKISGSYGCWSYDWDGELDGIHFSILSVEAATEPELVLGERSMPA